MKKKFVRPEVKASCKYEANGGNANQTTIVACTVLPNQKGPASCSKY